LDPYGRHETSYVRPELVRVAAEEEPDDEPDGRRDRDRGAGIFADVLARVVPEIPVVLLEPAGGLAHVAGEGVEAVARLRVGISERFARLIDLFLDEVAGAVERRCLVHASPPIAGSDQSP